MKRLLESDMDKCLNENINDVQTKIKGVEEKYSIDRKPVPLSF